MFTILFMFLIFYGIARFTHVKLKVQMFPVSKFLLTRNTCSVTELGWILSF